MLHTLKMKKVALLLEKNESFETSRWVYSYLSKIVYVSLYFTAATTFKQP